MNEAFCDVCRPPFEGAAAKADWRRTDDGECEILAVTNLIDTTNSPVTCASVRSYLELHAFNGQAHAGIKANRGTPRVYNGRSRSPPLHVPLHFPHPHQAKNQLQH